MDSLRLSNLVPDFLESEKINGSEIWNKDVIISKGEKIQLVAPSGSGKTSLIHFIYGLRADYSGQLSINDKNVKDWAPENWSVSRRSFTSIVFQDLRLFPDHTGRQNLEVKRSLEPHTSASQMEDMAARLGILEKLGQPARMCSYGEQQRIAIVRALLQPFDLLILDEPFSHLDDINGKKAMQLIEEEVAARKATLLLADLRPIDYYNADRVFYL